MSTPKVSVIVPNYNYARYLPQRILSILNQTFTDFELILLDDASTDNSVEVLQRYSNNAHVSQCVVNERNTGSPFAQWVKGMKLAKGEWIWIAEADDWAEPTFLETCLRIAAQHPQAVACHVGSVFIDAMGQPMVQEANYWGRKAEGHRCMNGRDFAEHNLYWSCCIMNTSGTIFKREVALRLPDTSFTSMRYAGDWLFWFQMALQGDIIEIYQNLNGFRQHSAKVTCSGQRKGDGIVEDIRVVRWMESQLSIQSRYKRRLAHGLLYRKIRHAQLPEERKEELYGLLYKEVGGSVSDFYLSRRNRIWRFFCPWILTMKRDRLA